jgi:hypothetical protein
MVVLSCDAVNGTYMYMYMYIYMYMYNVHVQCTIVIYP